MSNLLSFEIIWQDDDLVEIRVLASNDTFSGSTEVYTNYSELKKFAHELEGFPKSIEQFVSFICGEKKSYALAELDFYCFSNSGHTGVQVKLEANTSSNQRKNEKHSICLEIQFESSAADDFVTGLKKLIENKSGKAELHGISPFVQNIE